MATSTVLSITVSELPSDILTILESQIIPIVNIILNINLFTFFLILSFFRKNNFQHILKCNRNLTITGIFEKYSNKNTINFNRKNL